jgi:TolB protein
VSGGVPEQLTDGGYTAQAEYSPDGETIAYQNHDGEGFDIYVTPVGGGMATRLSVEAGDDTSPRWSPDGTSIAFLAATDGTQDIQDLQVVSVRTGDVHRLAEGAGVVTAFDWLSDDSLVYSLRSGSVNLWTIEVDQLLQRTFEN